MSPTLVTYLDQLRDRHAQHTAAMDAILDRARTETRDLNDAETAALEQERAAAEPIRLRILALAAAERDRAEVDTALSGRPAATPTPDPDLERNLGGGFTLPAQPRDNRIDVFRVGGEEAVYHPARSFVRTGGFLLDAARAWMKIDDAAEDRISRHRRQMEGFYGREQLRAASDTANFAGLVVPNYLTDMVAEVKRAGRPTADLCAAHPLPETGMTAYISRITTGTTVAAQATQGATPSSTQIDDTLLQVDVVTVAGFNDISRQAVMRGVGVDDVTVRDLQRAYNAELDRQIINGSGASGEMLGIRNTVGINAVTYTDVSPTVPELWPKLVDAGLNRQLGSIYQSATDWVMVGRRFAWIFGAVDSSNRPLVLPNAYGPNNALGTGQGRPNYGPTGYSVATLPITVDGNVPTNVGAGTEDVILGVTADELHLWEDPSMPMQIRFEDPTPSLRIRIVLFGFAAFTAGRYPSAHSVISGTGLIAPTF